MGISPPLVMGILNVTPDSFHDGGRHDAVQAAVARGLQLATEGADWIDVGGESTRPGAAEERVVPVIRALRAELPGLPISIDTRKAAVAVGAIEAGASAVNDVSALGDPAMAGVVAQADCQLVLMHMLGTPATMQREPGYHDVVADVASFLDERLARAVQAGIPRARIWLDPGIGFGKTAVHNLSLVRGIPRLAELGQRVLLGASRKSFIGQVLELPGTEDRLEGSLAVAAVATWLGVHMLRVHDVLATRRVLRMVAALQGVGS